MAKRLGELPAAHVHRVHLRRVALQQQVREPARGRSHVQARQPNRLHAECVQRRPQLQPAARDERRRRLHLQIDRGLDEISGLAIGPGAGSFTDANMAAENQSLGASARLGQTPIHKQLIEAFA